ncbi:dNA polymerase III polC-type [Clostridium sp. CAG:411]|nr:dNA polymerase III polC-type [Clostridium sp. CAG:411]
MLFFEAFDNLTVSKDMQDLFEHVDVKKMVASKGKKQLSIYIKSDRLITFTNIKKMEYQLKKQVFQSAINDIVFVEQYELSEQYTAEKLMPIYYESFLLELKEKSIIDFEIINTASYEFVGNQLIFDCERNFLSVKRSAELREYFQNLFLERFGYEVQVEFKYHDAPKKEEEEEFFVPYFSKEIKEKTVEKEKTSEKKVAKEKEPAKAEKKEWKRFDKSKSAYRRLPDDPDIIYGRSFEGDSVPISEIVDEIGEVVIVGKILSKEEREIRNEKTIVIFNVTDFTDTITVKIFVKNEQLEDISGKLSKGAFVRIKGMAVFDRFDKEITIGSVVGIKTIGDFTTKREDHSPKKRVELHAHTLMSDMDAVVDVKTMIKRAKSWGHKAIAITDHGVVQSFTEAAHCLDKDDDFKIIYGMEGYLVDDVKDIVENDKGQSLDDACVVFDIETTGFSATRDRIIEIGAVKVIEGKIVDKYSTFVNPDIPIPFEIENLTHITDEMVMDAPMIDVILPQFLEFCKGCILVAHNASFDVGFIRTKAAEMQIETDFTVVDTVGLARMLLPKLNRFKLNVVAKELHVSLESHHRAVDDAGATAEIFVKFIAMLKEKGITTLLDINKSGKLSPEVIKKLPTYHVIILAKNELGRINLYRLVSKSHIEYYNRRPRIPKSLLEENREGLIIGSACEAGELYRALVRKESQDEITRIVNFYDYLEIQPIGNNEFMKRSEKSDYADITTDEDLQEYNKKIVELAEQFHKLCVATCDVHFLDPEDEVYRRIIMAGPSDYYGRKGICRCGYAAAFIFTNNRRDVGRI